MPIEKWVMKLSNENLCISCHQRHGSSLVFCEICLPWTNLEKESQLKPAPEFKVISLVDFLHKPEFNGLSKLEQPNTEFQWQELILAIYKCTKNTRIKDFDLQIKPTINYLLDLEEKIDNCIHILAEREAIALSYYSHFKDLDPADILEDEAIKFRFQDYTFEFDIIRTKHGIIPSNVFTPANQSQFISLYHLDIVKINDEEVHLKHNSIASCAEIIELHREGNLTLKSCIQEIESKQIIHDCVDFDYDGSLPKITKLQHEFNEIISGNQGLLAKELMICSLYKYQNLGIIEPIMEPSRVRSFQFLGQIVADLGSCVTPIREGLLVESISGNSYQIEKSNFLRRNFDVVVFWTVHEVFTGKHICIDIVDNENILPDGDYLATILLSLYDDHDSSRLIHTLPS